MGNRPVITPTHAYSKNRHKKKKQTEITTLGFTGLEKEIPCAHRTICSVCLREIKEGDPCLQAPNEKGGRRWRFHADCAIAELTRAHVVNTERAKKRRRYEDPKPRISDGSQACSFCHKKIYEGHEYVKAFKKTFHSNNQAGKQKTCWKRFKAVNGALMNSLRR